jgi:two-component system response regulator FixJ
LYEENLGKKIFFIQYMPNFNFAEVLYLKSKRRGKMTKHTDKRIFFVDDEPKIREVVGDTLEQLDVNVTCFADGAECLKEIKSKGCDLLITDMKMPVMDGLELMKRAKSMSPWLPVLVITGYGDIPLAVETMKSGAVDFMEKPFDKVGLLRKVDSILRKNQSLKTNFLRPLTPSESKILKSVISGKSNREIAESLNRSVRTVEVHRSHIMKKFGVETLVELMKKAALLGLVEISEETGDDTEKQNKTTPGI